MYSKVQLSEITIDNVIYALDSTTISTSIKLAAWALGKYSKGVLKEFPPEKTLDMIAKVWEMAGILVDERR